MKPVQENISPVQTPGMLWARKNITLVNFNSTKKGKTFLKFILLQTHHTLKYV
jgi:hypothetical protein